MNIRISITVIMLLTTVASGCSRMRGMTRRDYAQIQDPFLHSSESYAGRGNAADQEDIAGRVRLDMPDTASSTNPAARAVADYSRAVPSRTASLQQSDTSARRSSGPSLADFVGKTAPSSSAAAGNTPTSAADFSKDLAAFSDFAAGEQPAAQSPVSASPSPSLDPGFAAWASQQSDKWVGETQQVAHKVQDAGNDIIQSANQVRNAVNQVAAPAIADDSREVATPLIRKPSVQNLKAPAPEFDATENPFEALERQTAPAAETSQQSTGTSPQPAATPATAPADAEPTLDSKFDFDAGWKPSHLSRP